MKVDGLTKENFMRTKSVGILILCIVCTIACLCGCSSGGSGGKKPITGGNEIAIMPTTASESESNQGSKSLSLTGILLNIDLEQSKVTIQTLDTSKKIEYNYNGGTYIIDRYDSPLTIAQLNIGEVVDFQYLEKSMKLISIKVSDSSWEYNNATNLSIDADNQSIMVGSQKYTYSENLNVIHDGRVVNINTLESVDVVTLKGRDKQIDSIVVTNGHGYVRLDSTAFFEGGYIEIGTKILKIITENMVIPVPVGTYKLTVTKDDTIGSKEIEVFVNEEMRINLADFQGEAVRYGSVHFKISPSGATLKVDGKKMDYSALIDLTYGNHTVVISKDGYEDYTQTINVKTILSEYDITLIETGETSASETEETSTTSSKDDETTKNETTTNSNSYLNETTSYNYESAWYGILSGFLD